MTFKEICLQRQACRNYLPKAIEPEKMDYIMECARLSPSACNFQPWTLYIAESPDAVAKVQQWCYSRDWAKTAPAFIIVCINHEQEWVRPSDGKRHGTIDVSIIAEHICLAASEAGLSTCWVCNFDIQKTKEVFDIPENEEPAILIPIGYSEEPVREKSRKSTSDIIKRL